MISAALCYMRKQLFIAISLLLCLSMCSCGIVIINEGPNKPKDTTTGAQTTDTIAETDVQTEPPDDSAESLKERSDALFDALTTASMSGVRFVVATVDDTFLIGDGSETQLSSQRTARIARIEKKLNTEISIKRYTSEELYNQASAAYKSGDYFADILAIPQTLTGIFASDGILYNMRAVPNFDTDAEYFDKNAESALTAGHILYGVTGDGCFEPEKIFGLYYNRTLGDELGLDPYPLVSSGEWTLDKYNECDKAAKTAEKTVAVSAADEAYNTVLLYGSGFDFTLNAPDKTPVALTFTDEFKALCELFSGFETPEGSDSAMKVFSGGGVLFCADNLTAGAAITDSAMNWGLLPMPKLSGKADYSSYISDGATVLCILNGTDDKEIPGDFIEALCASSYGYIEHDFIYYNMINVLRDNDSVNNMKRLIDGVNYDFTNIMSTGYPTLYENTVTAFENIAGGLLAYDEYAQRAGDVEEYLIRWFPVKYQ